MLSKQAYLERSALLVICTEVIQEGPSGEAKPCLLDMRARYWSTTDQGQHSSLWYAEATQPTEMQVNGRRLYSQLGFSISCVLLQIAMMPLARPRPSALSSNSSRLSRTSAAFPYRKDILELGGSARCGRELDGFKQSWVACCWHLAVLVLFCKRAGAYRATVSLISCKSAAAAGSRQQEDHSLKSACWLNCRLQQAC